MFDFTENKPFNEDDSVWKRRAEALLENNPFLAANEIVYQIVLEDIIAMRLLPGTRLRERRIAEMLNISRTPVRDAISRLADEFFLVISKGNGTYVRGMTKNDIQKLLYTRGILETSAARLATEHLTEERLLRLKKLAYQSVNTDILSDASEKDHKFHRYIFECSENDYLVGCYNAFSNHIRHLRNYIMYYSQQDWRVINNRKEHLVLCAIFEIGSPEVSEAYMKKHVSSLHIPPYLPEFDYQTVSEKNT